MPTEVHCKSHSPSKLELIFNCPLSARYLAMAPNEEAGEAAIRGNCIHNASEYLTKKALHLADFSFKKEISYEELIQKFPVWDVDMDALAKSNSKFNVDLVDVLRKERDEEPTILCEETLDMSYLLPGMIGTVDFAVINSKTLIVSDLKTGFVKKNAGKRYDDGGFEINPQIGCYCSAIYHQFKSIYPKIEKIRLIIHQEAQKHISDMEFSIDEFLGWERGLLIPAIQATLAKDPECNINPLCKYCPGHCFCKKVHENFYKVKDLIKTPSALEDEAIDSLLPKVDEVVQFTEAIKEYAINRMKSGIKYPTHKLVYSKITRKIKDEEKVISLLKEAGFEPYSPSKMLGITELSKKLGKEKFNQIVGPYIQIVNGSITLANLDDTREEVNIEEFKKESDKNEI